MGNKENTRMTIYVQLNKSEYEYDVYHMFKLFFNEDVKFNDENPHFKVDINDEVLSLELLSNELSTKEELKVWKYQLEGKYTFKEELRKGIFEYLKKLTDKQLPWGTLTGIRPSKRAMKMMDEGYSNNEIIEDYRNRSYTSTNKAELCIEIAQNEAKFINKNPNLISIYVGMPFCPTKCLYCSFTSNPVGKNKARVEKYIEALTEEISMISDYIKSKGNIAIETVYFGGGTPTAVNDKQFKTVMKSIHENFITGFEVKEFTVECGRPDSITEDKLLSMREYGASRISINPQTMNDDTLHKIGRKHSVEDIHEVYNLARRLGFDNINMDLIIGLPGEKVEEFDNTLTQIKTLNPESITVHGMSVKRASVLHERMLNQEKFEIAEQNDIVKMFDNMYAGAKELNMIPYYMYRQKNMVGNMENVGFSKIDKECIYNIIMIEDTQSILALGAGAVSKVVFEDTGAIERVANNKDIDTYIDNVESKVEEKTKLLSQSLR